MSDPCGQLTGRMREICEGRGRRISARKRRDYLESWAARGLIPNGEFPPLVTQAANLTKAAGRVVKAVVTRKPVKVSQAVRDERKAICDECTRREEKRCLECGCRLSAKQWAATEDCPLGKWPRP